jgi:hypothetical protein
MLRPMEWAYKATVKQVDRAGTVMLANRGLLCRPVHEKTGVISDLSRAVAIGDVIHMYYTGVPGKTPEIGSFEVITKENHPKPEVFGDPFPETSLYPVLDDALILEVDTQGRYEEDRVLNKYTGWIIRKLGPAKPYDAKIFRGQSVLVRLEPEADSD